MDRSSMVDSSSMDRSSMMIGTMSSQMVSTSSNNSGLVSRGHSTVGVGHQVRDVQGTRIGMMDCRGSNMVDGSMVGSGHSSNGMGSMANMSGMSHRGNTMAVLGGQVVGLQSRDTGLIDGGDGSVGMTLQAEKALRSSQGLADTGGENQKLHDC